MRKLLNVIARSPEYRRRATKQSPRMGLPRPSTSSGLAMTNETGQTLVEAIVAIAVAVVIVTSMVALGIGTQRAANTNRTQTQNTKYGEDAMEIIRNIRDINDTGAIAGMTSHPNFGTCGATCKFTDLYAASLETGGTTYGPENTTIGAKFYLYYNDGISCPNYPTGWCLKYNTSGNAQTITSPYSRTVRIWDSNAVGGNDPYTSVKYVEVTISWTDGSGTHNSKTFTKLTNFK